MNEGVAESYIHELMTELANATPEMRYHCFKCLTWQNVRKKSENGDEPSFLLTDDEFELLLNIAIECDAHIRC